MNTTIVTHSNDGEVYVYEHTEYPNNLRVGDVLHTQVFVGVIDMVEVLNQEGEVKYHLRDPNVKEQHYISSRRCATPAKNTLPTCLS